MCQAAKHLNAYDCKNTPGVGPTLLDANGYKGTTPEECAKFVSGIKDCVPSGG